MASAPKYEPAENPAAERERITGAMQEVVQTLTQLATDTVSKKTTIEQRWMRNLRQFHGVYEDDVARQLNEDKSRSSVFINITRPKTNAWAARLGDLLFPNDEKNWGVQPTPIPELSRQAKELLAEAEDMDKQAQAAVEANNEAVDEQGAAPPELGATAAALGARAKELRDQVEATEKEIEIAKRASALMEREIDDQLTESRYPAISRDIIADMCKLGSGVLKGPIVRSQGPRLWEAETVKETDESGKEIERQQWGLAYREDPAPRYRRVNPWHFFPDPAAERIEDAGFTFERHIPNAKLLRKLATELDFDAEAVRRLLKDGPRSSASTGAAGDLGFMTELRTLEDEGNSANDLSLLDDRFVVWEFYGQLETEEVCSLIRATGRAEDAERYEEDADPMNPLMVRVFFCDDMLLKIEEDFLLDSGDPLYSVATFEKSESSILGGVGVPELMEDEQSMLNAAVRMMMDNGALAVGPQVVIDKDVIMPENGNWKMTARKVWQRIKSVGRGDDKTPPFEIHNIPINQQYLAMIVEMALRFVDESVSMPLIAQGEQGNHVTKTAQGMSMLFNSANVIFRHVVKNWDDDLTEPTIRRAYEFNMQFSPKDEIKGDMKSEARGTSVLLVREMQAEQLNNLLAAYSTHPILGVALKAYEVMRLLLQAMSINPGDVLLDKEDYLQKLAEMQEADAGQESPEVIRAQASIEVANISASSRIEAAQIDERIQDKRLEQAMIELGTKHELSLVEIQAMFARDKLKTDSDERKLAVETAIERENAREARAQGMQPTGSGGFISMGAEERG